MTPKESRPVRRGAVGKVPCARRAHGNSLAAYPTVVSHDFFCGFRKCRAATASRPRSKSRRGLSLAAPQMHLHLRPGK
jgi:hypothetical protein